MNNENECQTKYEMLKCIWMASQVIEYKLCDNKFDCENCMFDKVMRNLINKQEAPFKEVGCIVDVVSDKLKNIKYDDKIIYLKNNLVAKEICSNTFYLGINPILNCFFDTVNSISINDTIKNISTGQQIIQISGIWGTVSISSPVKILIHDKVSNTNDNPLMNQWHAIVGIENRELLRGRLSREEWDSIHLRALSIVEEIKSEVPKVGDTMMDGGNQIKFLHQLVGTKKYIIILNTLNGQ